MAKCYCEHGGSLAFHVLSFAVHATYGDKYGVYTALVL